SAPCNRVQLPSVRMIFAPALLPGEREVDEIEGLPSLAPGLRPPIIGGAHGSGQTLRTDRSQMSTHTYIVLTGALVAIPLMQSMQCGPPEASEESEGSAPLAEVTPRELVAVTSRKELEELGKRVFFDNISDPPRMSCSTCHDPAAGWTFNHSNTNKHQVAATGANPHTVGSLKSPSNAYASFIGEFSDECPIFAPGGICGGNFWNGRAEGRGDLLFPDRASNHAGEEVFENVPDGLKLLYEGCLGPTTDQALNPFSNPVEQNIANEEVCKHVASSKYAPLFELAWGVPIDCSDELYGSKKQERAVDISFKRIAVAIGCWQASDEVNSFSSKRDIALAAEAKLEDPVTFPLAGLTDQENEGHDIFYTVAFGPGGGAAAGNCAFCHSDVPFADDGTEPQQLYADDFYHNIGTPRNHEIPGGVVDLGLEGHTSDEANRGVHKTPTLRNVDKRPNKEFVKAYTHNGWFKSLESLVHFYNTSDVENLAN